MKSITYLILLSVLLSFAAGDLLAQNDNRWTRRGEKNQTNTKKETPEKLIEAIVGVWEIQGIYKKNKNISQADTTAFSDRIEFNREAQYVMYNEGQQIDSGRYRLNENHSVLYLESSTGEPSEWNISLSGGGMMLQRRDTHPHAESFRYVFNRTSLGSRRESMQGEQNNPNDDNSNNNQNNRDRNKKDGN